MKRIKRDTICSSVGHYLKKRQFTDGSEGYAKTIEDVTVLSDMSLGQVVRNHGSLPASLSFSSINGDATACDQQYNRIKSLINDCTSEHCRSELRTLLYPLFVHTYLELLCNGHKTPAHKFYSRHQNQFKEINHEGKEILDLLQNMFSKQDVLASDKIREFREHKFIVYLSEATVEYLYRFLKVEDNVLMLQIFNQHIQVQALGNSKDQSSDTSDNTEDSSISDHKTSQKSDDSKVPTSAASVGSQKEPLEEAVTLEALRRSIQRVRQSPPSPPSVCFYTFLNTYQGLCCCQMSEDRRLLCGGFEDSSIAVWSLTPTPLMPQTPTVNVSHVSLAGDSLEDHQQKLENSGCAKERVVMRGHNGAVYSMNFTQDDLHLLSASGDTTVRLWDLSTFTNKAIYHGHSYPVWHVNTSPVGTFFATCSADKTTKLWSTDRIHPLKTLIGHQADVNVVTYHPNGNYVATGSADQTVRLWNTHDGQTVRLFQGHHGGIHTLAFSPCGKYLASAGEDHNILLWDLGLGKLLKELKGHTDTVYSLTFNQDTTCLASGGIDGTLKIWDVHKTGKDSTTAESVSSPELLTSYSSKPSSVQFLRYIQRRVLLAAGAIIS